MDVGTINAVEEAAPLIAHPVGVLAILLSVLAVIFLFGESRVGGKFFSIVPKLVFCYFVPTLLTTLNVLPEESALYDWVRTYLLPASLLLMILALDVPGILRLGPKAVVMLLTGTLGVVVGAPVALLVMQALVELRPDTWQGMAALTGSWIGGGANMLALAEIAETPADLFAMMVIVDVAVANVWMGVLLFFAGRHKKIDAWTGADASAIEDLQRRVADFQERTTRPPTLTDLLVMLAYAFLGTWLAWLAGGALGNWEGVTDFLSASTWKFVLVTTVGLSLSFWPAARNLEGAGASKIGSVMLYLLVAVIGAGANFTKIAEAPALVVLGFLWMLMHVGLLLLVAKLIRAPVFFVAVGSQANIGGAASAPIVASAFHPTLAPVGVLLAVAGYVLGTYAGLLCIQLLKAVAGAA